MRETLAGRLKWENTGYGIRVEIPARMGWGVLFLTMWLAGWLFAGSIAIREVLNGNDPSKFTLVWLAGWAIEAGVAAAALIWSIGGRTILTLAQGEMTIQRTVFGMEWDTRRFQTSHVMNVRYVAGYYSKGHDGETYHHSLIRFEADDKTRSFASGISGTEAFALIDKMLDVYEFPKNRALKHTGTP